MIVIDKSELLVTALIIAVCVAGFGAIARSLAQISVVLSQLIPYAGIAFLLIVGAWAFEKFTDCNARKSKSDMISRIAEYQAITAMMRGEKPEILMEPEEEKKKLPLPIRLLESNGKDWK